MLTPERLMHSAPRLAAVLDAMADILLLCDRQGTILLANRAVCRLLGLRRRDVIGTPLPYPWLDRGDNRKVREGFRRTRREEILLNYPVRWRAKGGAVTHLSLAFASTREGFLLTGRDISDVQYAAQLQQMEDMVSRLLSELNRKATLLQVLQRTNVLILKRSRLGRVFTSIVAGAGKLLEHDLAGIYVLETRRDLLVPSSMSRKTAFARRLTRFPLRRGEGIIGEVALTGKMVVANNAQLDPRSRYPRGIRPEVEHFIAVPLAGRDASFGVLVVARHRNPPFLEDEADVVESFAHAVSVALEHAHLVRGVPV